MNETEFWPCEHISKDKGNAWTWTKGKNLLEDNKFFCSYCGAKRPEEPSDGLQIILQNFLHREGFEGTDISRIEKDLRAWKEDLSYKHRAKWTWEGKEKQYPVAGVQILDDLVKPEVLFCKGKKEKPKKLWEILDEVDLKTRFGIETVNYNLLAKAAIDWFKKNVLESLEKSNSLGWNACLREIKQRLVEEKEAF